jgi:hypothetical protein
MQVSGQHCWRTRNPKQAVAKNRSQINRSLDSCQDGDQEFGVHSLEFIDRVLQVLNVGTPMSDRFLTQRNYRADPLRIAGGQGFGVSQASEKEHFFDAGQLVGVIQGGFGITAREWAIIHTYRLPRRPRFRTVFFKLSKNRLQIEFTLSLDPSKLIADRNGRCCAPLLPESTKMPPRRTLEAGNPQQQPGLRLS